MKFLKNILIPNGEKEEVKVYGSWFVEWKSRHDEYAGNVKPEAILFITKEEAVKFANQLKEAFKLIKHTSGNEVTIRGNE